MYFISAELFFKDLRVLKEEGHLKSEIIFKPLNSSVIGANGEIVDRIGSTMDLARERVFQRVPDGYIIAAEQQDSGRGRKGGWNAGSGQSILVSIILRAGLRSSERMLVGIMGAVASAETLEKKGLKTAIKWPNDIVTIESRDKLRIKKIGGVLVESADRGDSAPALVLGIGLNINQNAKQLPSNTNIPPTSLRNELGRSADRNRICTVLFKRLDEWYKTLYLGKSEDLLVKWKNFSCLTGRAITASHRGSMLHGRVLGVSSDGKLILQTGPGGQKHYLSERDTRIILKNQ